MVIEEDILRLAKASDVIYELCTFPPTVTTFKPSLNPDGEGESGPLPFSDLIPTPNSYDKMKPPKQSEGEPTIVSFHVTVMGLDSINEYSMTYAADVFLAQRWKDHRLRLPENMTGEYRLLEVDFLQSMWRPDAFIKNAKQVTFKTMTVPNHYVWLHKDKSILYMVKLTLTLSCAMNFELYPHVTQECKMQMESLSHTTKDLKFEWETDTPLVVDPIELPQLQLVRNKTSDCTQHYSTGNFSCLEVVFVLKRRLGYYLFHTYIPTCLIVVMSWVSFWIQAAPARVTLGVTSLLTLSTFVFLALMEYYLVNIVLGDSFDNKSRQIAADAKNEKVFHLSSRMNFRGSTSEEHQHPRVMTTSFVHLGNQQHHQQQRSDIPPPPPPPPAATRPQLENCINAERRMRALAVDRFSRVAFPLTFTILNCVYWITFADYL